MNDKQPRIEYGADGQAYYMVPLSDAQRRYLQELLREDDEQQASEATS